VSASPSQAVEPSWSATPIASVAVVGGGFMGVGIAEAALLAGIPVVIRELPEYLDAARGRLETSLDRRVERGKVDDGDRDSALSGGVGA
jgi:3-hydroxyacyl-CoA dehydrogenase